MENIRNYDYSFIASEDPWVTLILTKREYEELPESKKKKCVYLPELAQEVFEALNLPDISELFASSCQIADIEGWEDEFELGTRTDNPIMITVDGKNYTISEEAPYICFLGANIVARLWMYRNPLKFSTGPRDKYVDGPRDIIVLEQLRYLYGVFHFELSNNLEDHGFVLYMTLDEIIVYNSYGGYVGFYSNKYDREEWLDVFISIWDLPFKRQLKLYCWLWGFDKSMINLKRKQLSLKKLTYRKLY